mgnify:CR=1 FL=1
MSFRWLPGCLCPEHRPAEPKPVPPASLLESRGLRAEGDCAGGPVYISEAIDPGSMVVLPDGFTVVELTPVRLWIVGQCKPESDAWDFQGVFADEAAAVAACRTRLYFVAQVTLNQPLPHESSDWPGAYFPLRQGSTT